MPVRQLLRVTTAALLALAACGDDTPTPTPDAGTPDTGMPPVPPAPTENLVEVATANGSSALVGALAAAGLDQLLTRPGPYTVFAPTDAAFSAAGELPTDPDLLANILLNHVLPYQADAATVLGQDSLRNSANRRLPVDASAPSVGGAVISTPDLRASNGVVHQVDGVIIPPTIPEAVAAEADLSTLLAAVQAASPAIAEALGGAGPITVFAPIDAAFEAVDTAGILADPALLDSVLQYHVVQGQVLEDDIEAGEIVTASGQVIQTGVDAGGRPVLTDARSRTVRIVGPDIRLRNGVVHLVDNVLLPAVDQVDLLETLRRSNLNGLASTADAAGLGSALTEGGPFTVFAPTDAALAAAAEQLPESTELLANVLLNHVVSGRLSSGDLALATSVTTEAGLEQLVDFEPDPPTVGAAELTSTTDLPASNGVIHVIDRVLVPPTVDTALRILPELSTLNAALEAASAAVRDPLAGDAPITVFAPVNSAFAGIDLEVLASDRARLDDLLAFHVSTGQTTSGALGDGQTLTMANGATLTVRIDGGEVRLVDGTGGAGVRVIRTDIRLRNGVVHLLEGVLNPGHLVEQARVQGLSTLVAALTRTGLSPVLSGTGPFTLFAPTDTAFEGLGLDLATLDDFTVASVLLAHVVPGIQDSAAVAAATGFTTASKVGLTVTSTQGSLRVGGAPLGSPLDVAATNGVLHTLDGIIVPPTLRSVVASDPRLSSLATVLDRIPLEVAERLSPDVLAGEAPVTLFAPTNDAFVAAGIDPATADVDELVRRLRHHVGLSGIASSDLLVGTNRVGTLSQNLIVRRDAGGGVTVEDGNRNVGTVVDADIRGLDGAVFLIDIVLDPR